MASNFQKRLAGCGRRSPDTSTIGYGPAIVHRDFRFYSRSCAGLAPRHGFYRAKRAKVFFFQRIKKTGRNVKD